MLRMPFRLPTDYYCENLASVDKQICRLLAERKELSNNKPGFPSLDLISGWSQQYGLNEDYVRSIFTILYHESNFVPRVEPIEFAKFIPILKSVVIDNILYAVTYMKQYNNASVVHVETEIQSGETDLRLAPPPQMELLISNEYTCRPDSGVVSGKGMQQTYVVSPPLPDDVTNFEFRINITDEPRHPFPEKKRVAFKDLSIIIK